jgi:hypothetical protein
MHDDLLFSAEPGSGIIIKPGDGLGLVAGTFVNIAGTQAVGNTSTFINYDIEAVLLHYPPPSAPPATGNTYSKSRVVNKG